MADPRMMTQISGKPGFLAALDQSGSTPGALRTYDISDSASRMIRPDRARSLRILRARGKGGGREPSNAATISSYRRLARKKCAWRWYNCDREPVDKLAGRTPYPSAASRPRSRRGIVAVRRH
jgi:hypothetical protein